MVICCLFEKVDFECLSMGDFECEILEKWIIVMDLFECFGFVDLLFDKFFDMFFVLKVC